MRPLDGWLLGNVYCGQLPCHTQAFQQERPRDWCAEPSHSQPGLGGSTFSSYS